MKKIKILLALFAIFVAVAPSYAQVSVEVTATIAPPPLVVYSQPPCPEDGYIWTPGYWAYDDADGYYWVPGVWVAPPEPDYYWTPCYWGYNNGIYGFYPGYWGPTVGFYGGVNYGYGYGGYGYGGGRWDHGHFRYNTAITNVNRSAVHNVYVDRSVASSRGGNARASFNGPGGVTRQPRPEERAAMNQPHANFTHEQESHQQSARQNRNQLASVNHGRPAVASMNKVGGHAFNSQGHSATIQSHPGAGGQPRGAINHAAPQQHMESHPQGMRTAPQQHVQSRPQEQMHAAPQQHMMQSHSQPAMHEQSHPQPAMREQPHSQPMMQSHPAPEQHAMPQQQHMQAAPAESHAAPMGGGGGEHMGGGERGGGGGRR